MRAVTRREQISRSVRRSAIRSWAGALLLWSLGAPAGAATVEEWRRDIDQIVADVRATHPDPWAKTGWLTFARAAEAIKTDLPRLSEEQRMVRAMALVATLGDGHTRLEATGKTFAQWYPFRLYEFTDGYFITGAHRTHPDLAGAQLIEIGGRPAAEALTAARALFGADNVYDAKERLHAVHNAALMKGLGRAGADGALQVKLKLKSGKPVSRTILPLSGPSAGFSWIFQPEYWGAVGDPEDWVSAFNELTVSQLRELDPARPAHLMYRRAFHAAPLAGGKAYYIQSNVMGGTSGKSLPALYRDALTEVDRLRPEHLIVDLRYNFGGDGSFVPQIVHQFLARKESPPWKNLYLLTGRRTFSAGVLLTDAFRDHLSPTVIGEPAGAPVNTYGDANSFDYPATGMKMFVSVERHQQGKSTDTSEIIPVDYPASFSFAEYASGRDPAVDPIVAGKEMRSITAIAAADGFAAALAAHADRKARFGSDPGWRAPSELDLRTVTRQLDDSGLTSAAIDVATLNTQLNPQEWRTWMNLGDILVRVGRRAEGIANYRRSLALKDPTNFNAARLQQAVDEFDRETRASSGN